jgi:5-formyltetrahydrofolate cyclo-ligase
VTSQDDKASLRRFFRTRRTQFVQSMTDRERALAFGKMPSPLARLCTPKKIVAGYVAVGSEVDPSRLLAEAEALGCALALPHVTSRAAPMRFLRWETGIPLVEGPFGLSQPLEQAEPVVPDIVLVPLLGFDDECMRLGQGAGHYDRALSLLDDAVAVGLAWSVQHSKHLPIDPWDEPMDAILTEKSWITR